MMQYSFANNSEDILLFRCFKDKREGYYVDVGANRPVYESVTCAFYDMGWCGLDVEPVPERARELRWARPRDIVVEAAASSAEGVATLYRTAGSAGLSSLDSRYLEQRLTGEDAELKKWPITVATRTLAAMLDENGVRDIDFLKIDVEGNEAEVLAGMDFSRWRPKVLVIEAVTPTKSPEPNHQRWEPSLVNSGYRFAYFDGLNRYYVRKESDALGQHFLTPVNVFDEGRRYAELGNALRTSGHPHHVFATVLAKKLIASFTAGELGDGMDVFARDLAPALLVGPASAKIAETLIRHVFAREPRKDEAAERLSGREMTGRQFLRELLDSREFKMICARVAV